MKNKMNLMKKQGFYVMALVLVAGILATAGIAGFVSGQKERQLAENAAEFQEKTPVALETEEAIMDEMTGYDADLVQKILTMIEDGALALEDFEDEESSVNEMAALEESEDDYVQVSHVTDQGYAQDQSMIWPVQGEIILDYSMENTIYFPTLDQYQCNPAILIQGEVEQPVQAAYKGTVTDIYEDERVGHVVVVAVGNNYETAYGQLTGIEVAVGDRVEQGDILGKIAVPTRFYQQEGSHVNFEVIKDGEPIDPLDCLK